MKNALIITMMLIFFSMSILTYSGVRNQSVYMQEYKRALDSGTDAAAKYVKYDSNEDIDNLGNGFGIGEENTNDIPIDKNASLEWFYRVFYRNLDLQDNKAAQDNLKKYIPMKALITYKNISIANEDDNWIVDKDFIINYNGNDYMFTLSDQIYDITNNTWVTDTELGLSTDKRQELVTDFIAKTMDEYINSRDNMESGNYYFINIGKNQDDERLKTIEGSSMIVLSEGVPMPALNWFTPQKKFTAFSIGGSEISRKK